MVSAALGKYDTKVSRPTLIRNRKTQLAIEHCNRIRQASPETWVFWVHASSYARCEQSLHDLADRVKIPGRLDRTANIFRLFRNWLQDEQIGRWVLVLDNVDDDSLLRQTNSEAQENSQNQGIIMPHPPLRYLLECSEGSIIITARNKRVALDITGFKVQDIIEVPPMDKTEAVDLLKKKLNISEDREDLEQLAESLEFVPMALIQAASYIAHPSRSCSVSQYLEDIRKSDRRALKLLQHEAGLLSQDCEASTSIIFTWQKFFSGIHGERPSAADLLSLMSFFERQGIPISILRDPQSQDMGEKPSSESECSTDSSSEDDWNISSDNESDADQQLREDIIKLHEFSLISYGENDSIFTMHRLVQISIRAWLRVHKKEAEWNAKFINNLRHAFPIGEYEEWEQCRLLYPHVKLAVLERPESHFSRQQWVILLYRASWYAQQNGKFAESVEMASKSKRQSVKSFGAKSTETLKSATILATAYMLIGLLGEAEKLEKDVTEISQVKLGLDHPSTLLSMNNLALIYQKQGRWNDAEMLFSQVFEISNMKLGSVHQTTLSSMNNLASIYYNQGKWQEAAESFTAVMENQKMKLGLDHPDTLSSMNNLALTYLNMGQWERQKSYRLGL